MQNWEDGVIVDFIGDKYIEDLTGFVTDKYLHYDHIPKKEEWRLGLRGGIFARFGALSGNGIVASPGVYFDYGITQLVADAWNIHSLLGRVDVTMSL